MMTVSRPLSRFGFLFSAVLGLSACDGQIVETYEHRFAIAPEATGLVIEQGSGDISVTGEPDRIDIEIRAELRSNRPGDLQDDDAKRSVRIDLIELDEQTIELAVGLHDPPLGYHLDLQAWVPSSIALDLDDDSGDISIEGVRELRLVDDSGDIAIESIDGVVIVNDGSGDIFVGGIAEELVIDDASGDIRIENAARNVDVEDGSGDISIEHVAGIVTLRDGSGDIAVDGAEDVVIENDGSGDVAIR